MNSVELLDLPPESLEGDVLAVPYFLEERPLCHCAALPDWRLNGALTKRLLAGDSTGVFGEMTLIQGNGKLGTDWVLFAGGGEFSRDLRRWRKLIEGIFQTCLKAGFSKIALCLPFIEGVSDKELRNLVEEMVFIQKGDFFECRMAFSPPFQRRL